MGRSARGDARGGASRPPGCRVAGHPRTTRELARRLRLSRATVSCRLRILHRAGLLPRSHHSRHVFHAVGAGTDRERGVTPRCPP
ncbi:helix-turn-helix domain-containing protein [Streptomyces sp. NPDC001135]